MHSPPLLRVVLTCTWVATTIISPALPAQSTSVSRGADSLTEVFVTARRREEQLVDTPVAVTAISANDIEERQITTVAQIATFVPNVTFQTGAPTGTGGTTSSIFIRGVGSFETSLGTEPGVGVYVDDVYIARSVGSLFDLMDVASVQVLRGPQGTLFGRNSVGGAVLLTSRRPANTFSGSIDARIGDDERRELLASVDVPFGESVRTTFAGIVTDRDGYVTSDDSEAFGSTDRVGGRVVLEWEPTQDLRVTLTGDTMRSRDTPVPSVLLGLVPTIPGTPVPSDIQAVSNLYGTCFGSSVLADSGNPDCIDPQFIRGPFDTAGGYSSNNEIFDSQGSRPLSSDNAIDVAGTSLNLLWEINPALTLKSITAYRTLDAFWPSNSDHTPNDGIEAKNDLDQDQFSQEVQLLGTNEAETLDWVIGAYYLREDGESLNVVAFPGVIFRSGGGFDTESIAGFMQGTYKFATALDLTLGLRYTDERKEFDTLDNQQVIGILADPFTRTFTDLRDNPIPFVTGETPSLESTETTPHASLAYHVTEDMMAYVSYSRGYKSGGYEQRLTPGTPEAPRFDPEYVDSYEIGLKASLLDSRMQISTAIFYGDYSDLQLSVVDGPAPTLTNAGDATLQGAELELSWLAVDNLTVRAFAGYLDAEYDKLSDRALNSGVQLTNHLPNTSEWQYGASAGYQLQIAANWLLQPYIEWSYRSDYYLDAANESLLHQSGYSLVAAALTLATTDDRWAIAVSGRNLLDETYLVSGMAQYNIGQIEGQYERPRQWMMSVKYRF